MIHAFRWREQVIDITWIAFRTPYTADTLDLNLILVTKLWSYRRWWPERKLWLVREGEAEKVVDLLAGQPLCLACAEGVQGESGCFVSNFGQGELLPLTPEFKDLLYAATAKPAPPALNTVLAGAAIGVAAAFFGPSIIRALGRPVGKLPEGAGKFLTEADIRALAQERSEPLAKPKHPETLRVEGILWEDDE